MSETILKFLLKGAEIFTTERRRYFQKTLLENNQEVLDLENARHPDYNDAKLALAKEKRDNFIVSYQKEFEARLDELKLKGIAND